MTQTSSGIPADLKPTKLYKRQKKKKRKKKRRSWKREWVDGVLLEK